MNMYRGTTHAFILCTALSAACGDKPAAAPAVETQPAPAQAAPTPPPAPAVAPVQVIKPDADGIVRVTANDQMRYNGNRIELPADQKKVKIELKNVGTLPKEAMGHDLVVLKSGADAMAFGAKAIGAKATDYIPQDALDQIVAHTKLLGPGETDVIEFDVPGPGSYPFLCTFPGHVALMSGVIAVGP